VTRTDGSSSRYIAGASYQISGLSVIPPTLVSTLPVTTGLVISSAAIRAVPGAAFPCRT
jgi:hypothetical protein